MKQIPLIFSSSATLAAPGASATLDSSKLRPEASQPFWIDEIRLHPRVASMTASYNFTDVIIDSLGSLVSVAISLGSRPITEGFVRMGALGPIEAPAARTVGTWKLPRPLLVLPGESVRVAVKRRSLNDPLLNDASEYEAVDVTVALVGRYADGVTLPSSRAIPYVIPMETPLFDYTQAYSYQADLINRLGESMKVQRLVSRLLKSSPQQSGQTDFRELEVTALPTDVRPQLRIERTDSTRHPVPEYSDAFALFNSHTWAMDMPITLPPSGGLRISALFGAGSHHPALTQDRATLALSLIGHRMEAL